MTERSWEQAGSEVFRWTFAASLALPLYALCASIPVALPEALPTWFSSGAILGVAAGLAGLIVALARRRYPAFLASPTGLKTGEGLMRIMFWCIPTYLVTAAVIWSLAYLLVAREDPHWLFLVYVLPLSGPSWFCVPPATILAWWTTR